jgi:hypothetical protein
LRELSRDARSLRAAGNSCRPALVLVAIAGCSGGGSTTAPAVDAAGDTQAETSAGYDSGDCFPYCPAEASTGGGDDAGNDAAALTCAALQASYEAYELTAKACNPQLPGQCTATTSDPCCPVTVGGNASAVDDFDQAVSRYEVQCTADCSRRLCQPAPSGQCVSVGTAQGTCM